MTKSELNSFKEHVDRHFLEIDHKFGEVQHKFNEVEHKFRELELRLTVKLGFITVSSMSVGVAILAWLIQIK